MTKIALKNLTAAIATKRREVTRLQEDLGDMLDHLAVIEARAKSAGGKRHTTADIKKALGICSVCSSAAPVNSPRTFPP